MLLKHRTPGIESRPANTTKGFEHLDGEWIAVLRWLQANRIEYVLVGPVARAIRGDAARGTGGNRPGAVRRNLDRWLTPCGRSTRGCESTPARRRRRRDHAGEATAEKLVRGQRWTLRCGVHDIDVEGRPTGVPRYQELLYEAGRFELTPDLKVEAASPEDIEHYEHVRRTGIAPEFRVARNTSVEHRLSRRASPAAPPATLIACLDVPGSP